METSDTLKVPFLFCPLHGGTSVEVTRRLSILTSFVFSKRWRFVYITSTCPFYEEPMFPNDILRNLGWARVYSPTCIKQAPMG